LTQEGSEGQRESLGLIALRAESKSWPGPERGNRFEWVEKGTSGKKRRKKIRCFRYRDQNMIEMS